VSDISANKLLLQELTQLIKIILLISRFLQIFTSSFQFPGDANARFAPPHCGRPCAKCHFGYG